MGSPARFTTCVAPESPLRQISGATNATSPLGRFCGESLARARGIPREDAHFRPRLEQSLHELTPDEARGAGDGDDETLGCRVGRRVDVLARARDTAPARARRRASGARHRALLIRPTGRRARARVVRDDAPRVGGGDADVHRTLACDATTRGVSRRLRADDANATSGSRTPTANSERATRTRDESWTRRLRGVSPESDSVEKSMRQRALWCEPACLIPSQRLSKK